MDCMYVSYGMDLMAKLWLVWDKKPRNLLSVEWFQGAFSYTEVGRERTMQRFDLNEVL